MSSYFSAEEDDKPPSLPRAQGAMWNTPRHPSDLYTPRFVRGRGKDKVGLCPICCESVQRGGEGKKVWLAMKVSAFNYHMQYYHGISSASTQPFSPPLAFRVVARVAAKNEKSEIEEGKCHKCKKWIPLESIRDTELKVKELFWWKHAATCHRESRLEGERDIFLEDDVWKKLRNI
ncbi:uncharacterized protein STEHIDRAFT_148337 [Stereum hirsutum FP-91666 SS1]|uniref:uncharacterized protein n=1 Tax=Stereum hirsutum (strain FP-91666) TaxID=721885 RepID=UPI00044497C9|nr:uncharacterized protein STEHIDRAFT_148337 [Stereum hirsutum FP-91666 SS1]EIM85150.1 hypothetical protein STEHIDRAFT_148337 [Stereum hirsutum FP-91666 SS1]